MGRLLASLRVSYKNWHYPYAVVIKPTDKKVKILGMEYEIPLMMGNYVDGFWIASEKPVYLYQDIVTRLDLSTGKARIYWLNRNSKAYFVKWSIAISPRYQAIIPDGNGFYLVDFVTEKAVRISTGFEVAHYDLSCSFGDVVYAQVDASTGYNGKRVFIKGDPDGPYAVAKEGIGYANYRGHLIIDDGIIIWCSNEIYDYPPFKGVIRPFENLCLTLDTDEPGNFPHEKPFVAKSNDEFFVPVEGGSSEGYALRRVGNTEKKIIWVRGAGLPGGQWLKTDEGRLVYTPEGARMIAEDPLGRYALLDAAGPIETVTRNWLCWVEKYDKKADKTILAVPDDKGNLAAMAIIDGFFPYRFARFCGETNFEAERRGQIETDLTDSERPPLIWESMSDFSSVSLSVLPLSQISGIELVDEIDLSSSICEGIQQKEG